jgi:hypothetical protein
MRTTLVGYQADWVCAGSDEASSSIAPATVRRPDALLLSEFRFMPVSMRAF